MSSTITFTEDERDCLQEMVNVAIGKAGDSLARYLGLFVNLSIPKIILADAATAGDTLHAMVGGEDRVIAVRQEFTGAESKLEGAGIVLFTKPTLDELLDLVKKDSSDDAQRQDGLLTETTKIINGGCLSGLGEQLGVAFRYSPPSIMGKDVETRKLLSDNMASWPQALLVEINYTLEQGKFRCNWLLLLPGEAIASLKQAIEVLLADD
jgi:chemotaxis protein CheY-P-specific phosphatase CheC